MENKNIIIVVILAVFVLLAGMGGYFMGSKSSMDNSAERPAYNNNRGALSSGFPSQINKIDNSKMLEELLYRLKENPNDASLQGRIGDVYFEMKSFNEAIPYYKKAIELNPGAVDNYNDLGLAYHYQGNSAEGLKHVNKGIETGPDYQTIWLTKGFILASGFRELEEARLAWEKAKSIDPESKVGKSAIDFLAKFRDYK